MRSAVCLLRVAALLSYAVHVEVPRTVSVLLAPLLLDLELIAHRAVRGDLYRCRVGGRETQATVVIGNTKSVLPMLREIQRVPSRELSVVSACVSGLDLSGDGHSEVESVPVFGGEVELVVSPGLLGVAGPRLSIRPAAGMTLLQVERPVMSGGRSALKDPR
jgi:hypothetical protein